MKKITNYVLYFAILLIPLFSLGQGIALPFSISGFNADVIANGTGAATISTNNDVDGVSYAFKSLDWKLTATSAAQVKGFPVDGVIHSLSTPGLYFKLAPYDQNNSIRLSTVSSSVTSNLTTTYSASKIHILTTGGSGPATLGGTITFTDNTTQVFTGVSVPDWYSTTGLPQTYINFGRINITTNAIEDGTDTSQPRLFQGTVDIIAANQSKIIQSITFTKSAGSGIINVFAVSAEIIETCVSPVPVTLTSVSALSATMSWTAPTPTPQNGYQYEIRNSGMPGSGSTGLASAGAVTVLNATATGLQPQTKYYLYIRSVCTAGNGIWKWVATFTTPCVAMPGNFSENFDILPTGGTTNPSISDCWTYLDSHTGYGYTTATASRTTGGKGFYVYMPVSTGDLKLISPMTNNLGNGAKQLRFWAKISSASYSTTQKLGVYTMNGNTGTATKTLVENKIPLTTTWQEFIIPLPVTTDDYFAFSFDSQNSTAYVYLDDIFYEDLLPCIFPMNINSTSITTTSSIISWNSSIATGVTGYEYEVRFSGAAGSGATGLIATGTTNATTTTANIAGLTSGTNYTVYVRSLCGTTSGMWTTFPHNFNTLCGVVNSIYENFDTTATGTSTNLTAPYCWTSIDEVITSGYNYVSSTYSVSTSNSYYMYRTNTSTNSSENLYLISPETNNLGGGAKRLRFKVRATSTTANVNKLEILRSNGVLASSSFTVVSTVYPDQTSFVEYIVNLPNTTDDYFVFRLAHNGLTSSSTIYIDDVYYEDIPLPTLTTTKMNNVCNGGNVGSASVVVAGGLAPFTYSWSPSGGTTAIATGLTAGTYTVTVTDALNRTATATVTVTQPDQILTNSIITQVTCNSANNGAIIIAPTGGTIPYTYLWNTGATGATLSNLAAGTYSVTITDTNGCTG
ncbi:fibronectin type III domain-containing protein, partial [Paenimyroides baculatum]